MEATPPEGGRGAMPWPPVQPRAPRASSTDLDGSGPKGIGALPWQPPIFMATRPVPDPGEEAAFARSGPPQAVSLRVCPPRRVFLFSCRSSGALIAPSRFLPRALRMVRDGRELSPLPRARSGGKPTRNLHPPTGLPPPAVPALPLQTARLLGMPDKHKK